VLDADGLEAHNVEGFLVENEPLCLLVEGAQHVLHLLRNLGREHGHAVRKFAVPVGSIVP
jgi:hypothetical protein